MRTYREDYLSDQELEELIRQVEEQDMIAAPDYLEEKICTKIRQSEQVVQYRAKKSTRQRLFFYSLKVIAASAAAIAFLYIVPMVQSQEQPPTYVSETQQPDWSREAAKRKEETSFVQNVNQATNQFCNSLFRKTNALFQKEEK